MTVISAPSVLIGDALAPAAIVIEGDVIVDILDAIPPDSPDHVRLDSGILSAGMIDTQINGFAGTDFAEVTADTWPHVMQAIAATGVTSCVPTLITAPLDAMAAQVRRLSQLLDLDVPQGSRALGLHLEGPFLSLHQSGAHDREAIIAPTTESLDRLLSADPRERILIMTLAPESEGGLEAIRRITTDGIVASVGHSDATAAQLTAAVDCGATLVTHLYNAQRGLHHREAGVVGAALVDTRLRLGLIADLHHVSPTAMQVAFAAAPDRVVLVTDAVAAAAMPPGTYVLAGEPAEVSDEGEPPRRPDGTLAGSSLTLDAAVRNVVGIGVTVADALVAATRTPADALRRHDLGRLDVGARADLVWWNHDLTVGAVWRDGVRLSHAPLH